MGMVFHRPSAPGAQLFVAKAGTDAAAKPVVKTEPTRRLTVFFICFKCFLRVFNGFSYDFLLIAGHLHVIYIAISTALSFNN